MMVEMRQENIPTKGLKRAKILAVVVRGNAFFQAHDDLADTHVHSEWLVYWYKLHPKCSDGISNLGMECLCKMLYNIRPGGFPCALPPVQGKIVPLKCRLRTPFASVCVNACIYRC